MRAPLFVLGALAFAGFLACADDSSRPSTTFEDGGARRDAAGSDIDAGKRAPTGCLLSSTGFRSARKIESVPRASAANGAAWSDIANAGDVDGRFASVTLAEGQESESLRLSDFGFAIPVNGETWGIEVALTRQAPDGGVADARIDIEIENQTTNYKLMETPWPASDVGTHEYGQPVDTWGADVSPDDFNRPAFAAKLAVKRAPGVSGPVTGLVDAIRVAVYYCAEPTKK